MCFPSPDIGSETKESATKDTVQSTVEKLIAQILSIEPSQTKLAGKIRFDLPESGGGFVQHKDLYSAWLISSHMTYLKLKTEAIPTKRMPMMGIIIPRVSGF
jgi:hypothetical protein